MPSDVKCFRLVVLIIILIIASLIMPTTITALEVSIDKVITDPEGDEDSYNAENFSEDGDIILLESSESGGTVIIELTVLGTVYTSVEGEYDEASYTIFIDINPPTLETDQRIADWMITIYNTNYQSTMSIVDNDALHEYTLTSADVTGHGTSTLLIKFPLSYITDTVTGWDMKGDVEVKLPGDSYNYQFADDNTGGSWSWEYGSGGDGDGGDGGDGDGDDDGDGSGWEWPEIPHPVNETPTDTSISVAITTASWSYKNSSGYLYIDIYVQGTTNGVDHCELYTITHFNDGSEEKDEDWEERFEMDNFKFGGVEFTYNHFKETSDNWHTWEYRMEGKTKLTNDTDYSRYPTQVDVWLRAFKDDTEVNWNQATKATSVRIEGLTDGDGSDDDKSSGGFIPGFEVIIVLSAISLVSVISRFYDHKK